LHYANNARSEHADAAGPSMLLGNAQRSRRQAVNVLKQPPTTVYAAFTADAARSGTTTVEQREIMRVIETAAVLTGLAQYLADEQLAQFNSTE